MATKREMKVSISGQSVNPTRIDLQAGKFAVTIDEPASMGGTDAGPSPVHMLLMALAGCLHVTGHEIARQNNLTLKGMKIDIEGVLNPCMFMGCSFEERAGFKNIQVIITPDFVNATTEEVTSWLKETERRCPVSDNVRSNTEIEVQLIHE